MSRLVRSSRMGVLDIRGPGLECAERCACSLCCQQYSPASRGLSTRSWIVLNCVTGREPAPEPVTGRRHGRPLAVIPLQVVEGFLESDLSRRASGVLTKKGIFKLRVVVEPFLRGF